MVELLLGAPGAEALLNKRDSKGTTPLYFAVMGGSVGVVRCLLARGARPEIPNRQAGGPCPCAPNPWTAPHICPGLNWEPYCAGWEGLMLAACVWSPPEPAVTSPPWCLHLLQLWADSAPPGISEGAVRHRQPAAQGVASGRSRWRWLSHGGLPVQPPALCSRQGRACGRTHLQALGSTPPCPLWWTLTCHGAAPKTRVCLCEHMAHRRNPLLLAHPHAQLPPSPPPQTRASCGWRASCWPLSQRWRRRAPFTATCQCRWGAGLAAGAPLGGVEGVHFLGV